MSEQTPEKVFENIVSTVMVLMPAREKGIAMQLIPPCPELTRIIHKNGKVIRIQGRPRSS